LMRTEKSEKQQVNPEHENNILRTAAAETHTERGGMSPPLRSHSPNLALTENLELEHQSTSP